MIQNKTARALMYDWHDGSCSALYAAASSGLVADWDALEYEARQLIGVDAYKRGDMLGTIEGNKLIDWIACKRKYCKQVHVQGRDYYTLPWRGAWGCKA